MTQCRHFPMHRLHIRRVAALLSVALLVCHPVVAGAAGDAPRTALRVCADPFNLPMSSREGEGYENKIAELLADKLELPLEYEWFPQRIGFIRNTLRDNDTPDGNYKCDLVIGVIENFEIASPTRPYLRSTWAMVYVKGRGLDDVRTQNDLENLSAEQKAALRIGVWDRGSTTDWVFHHGLMEQATPYQSMSGDAKVTPGTIIEQDLVGDKVNLTFVWGPFAGYYAKKITEPEIVVIPMQNETGMRFDFQISMAVRHGDNAWKAEINELIEDNQAEINTILADYGVPMLDLIIRDTGDDDDD